MSTCWCVNAAMNATASWKPDLVHAGVVMLPASGLCSINQPLQVTNRHNTPYPCQVAKRQGLGGACCQHAAPDLPLGISPRRVDRYRKPLYAVIAAPTGGGGRGSAGACMHALPARLPGEQGAHDSALRVSARLAFCSTVGRPGTREIGLSRSFFSSHVSRTGCDAPKLWRCRVLPSCLSACLPARAGGRDGTGRDRRDMDHV